MALGKEISSQGVGGVWDWKSVYLLRMAHAAVRPLFLTMRHEGLSPGQAPAALSPIEAGLRPDPAVAGGHCEPGDWWAFAPARFPELGRASPRPVFVTAVRLRPCTCRLSRVILARCAGHPASAAPPPPVPHLPLRHLSPPSPRLPSDTFTCHLAFSPSAVFHLPLPIFRRLPAILLLASATLRPAPGAHCLSHGTKICATALFCTAQNPKKGPGRVPGTSDPRPERPRGASREPAWHPSGPQGGRGRSGPQESSCGLYSGDPTTPDRVRYFKVHKPTRPDPVR